VPPQQPTQALVLLEDLVELGIRGVAIGTGVRAYLRSMNWVPDECTLPTADRPLRTAQFREVFGELARDVERAAPGRLRLTLTASPEVAGRVAELAVRETECCSFFEFTLTAGKGLSLEIAVPKGREEILDAMAGSL
jgi:hypothetical protein